MMHRTLILGAAALGLFIGVGTADGADKSIKVINADKATHDGKFVSLANNKLVMSVMGAEHSHALTEDAKLTLDGKACQADGLKPGMRIRVTLNSAEPKAATQVEALDKKLDFASNQHDRKLVSVTGNKLLTTGLQGDEEHTCTLAANAQITLDGKVCQSSDLKPGMRIRVTSQDGKPLLASRIEALDKNPEFAGSE